MITDAIEARLESRSNPALCATKTASPSSASKRGSPRSGSKSDDVKDIPDADLKRFPVEMVSWDQCQIFVAKLNQLEKETGWVYRLPTEVEWEYACRAGTSGATYGPLDSVAWHSGN